MDICTLVKRLSISFMYNVRNILETIARLIERSVICSDFTSKVSLTRDDRYSIN